MLRSKFTKEYLTKFQLKGGKNETIIELGVFLVLIAFFWIFITSAPVNFDEAYSVEIEKGSSLKEISEHLKDEGLIRSRTVFNAFMILKFGETKIISGEYLFHSPPSIFEVLRRMTTGDYGIETKQIRVPEGATVKEIGQLFEQEFTNFDKNAFYQLTEGKEGYLFPDTYYFLENVKAHEVVTLMEETFKDKVARLKGEVDFTRSLEEIVIMASIIEKEATDDSRQEVSNILWKRIDIEMPLQVDATFVYSHGKGTFDLTKSDLTDEDNPYNTYVHLGLPPTPISNPGYESLKAAASEEDTDYLFFLTGHDGEMYYAKTFEGHKKNKANYLY